MRAKFNRLFQIILKTEPSSDFTRVFPKNQRPLRFVIVVVFVWLFVSCGITIFIAVDIAPPFGFICAVKFRVAAIRKLALAYQFKAAYVREDACRFLIGRHRAYGRIGRGGDTSSYSFVHAAISSALSSLWEKTRKLLRIALE